MNQIHLPRRLSPVHDQVSRLDPLWGTVQATPVAIHFAEPEVERVQAGKLALCDASALARLVVKGPGARQFLLERGIAGPDELFDVRPLEPGGLVARCGAAEFFLEDGCRGDAVDRLSRAIDAPWPGVYRLPGPGVSLLVSGLAATDVLAQCCGYNFRNAGDRLVMTRLAGIACWVLPRKTGFRGGPLFQLWADGTYGAYLWETVHQVVRELDGAAVGLACFFPEAGFADERT